MTYLVNSLTSQPWTKSGVLTVILYQLDILIVKVGQAYNEMYNGVVHSSHFRSIFSSFSASFLDHFHCLAEK